jgi:hypothetical protein
VLIGPIVWALHFTVIYAVHAFSCGLASDGRIAPMPVAILMAVWIATIAAIGLLGAALLAPERMALQLKTDVWSVPQRRFHRQTMSVLCLLSVVAILFAGASTLFVDVCALVR